MGACWNWAQQKGIGAQMVFTVPKSNPALCHPLESSWQSAIRNFTTTLRAKWEKSDQEGVGKPTSALKARIEKKDEPLEQIILRVSGSTRRNKNRKNPRRWQVEDRKRTICYENGMENVWDKYLSRPSTCVLVFFLCRGSLPSKVRVCERIKPVRKKRACSGI